MKNIRRMLSGCAIVLAIAAASVTAFAATYESPAEAAAGVTGKSLEEVIVLRQSGKSYGTIAKDAGKLEEFQQSMLELREEALDAEVEDGLLTQDQADAWLSAMEERQAICGGTGLGMGGAGCGRGRGMGMGARNGFCFYP